MIRRRFIFAALLFALAPAGHAQTAPSQTEPPVDLTTFIGNARPLVVFADGPDDPKFQQQMRWLKAEPKPLAERRVVVLTDTDPAANGPLRQRLRPHGFGIVLIDIDGQIALRRPVATTVREITRAIDRKPSRREELGAPRP